jgi:sec-independent protein translocase protein TatB
MFDIGFAELLIVAIVALLVLGPDKLPVAARTCALWLSRLRRTVSNVQREINEELRVDELRRTTSVSREKLKEELSEMSKPFAFNESDTASHTAQSNEAMNAKADGDASVKKSPTDE